MIAQEMRMLGMSRVAVDPLHNVVGYLDGDRPGPLLMLNAHTDHADVGSMPDPFSAALVDGSRWVEPGEAIYGRGACDMKGALAAMLHACGAVREAGCPFVGSVALAAVSREEAARGEGTLYVLEQDGVRPDVAVLGEATNLRVHLGHRGRLELLITTYGRTAHSSNPDQGINAVLQMHKLLTHLLADYRLPEHEFLGRCTWTVIDVSATPGRTSLIVPDRCELVIDRRILPGESFESVRAEIGAFVDRLRREDATFQASVELLKHGPPMYWPPDEPIVRVAHRARAAVLGDEGEPAAWVFGTDGNRLQLHGIPTVGIGPGSEQYAHTPEDHVLIDDLVTAAQIYAEIIASFGEACA